jgi:hypothetical protein
MLSFCFKETETISWGNNSIAFNRKTVGENHMISTMKVLKVNNTLLDKHGRITGTVNFSVCQKHKEDYFMNHAEAIVKEGAICVICHPRDNDSLGG